MNSMRICAFVLALFGCLSAQPSVAQGFPSKAIRLVNPFTPGGPLDLLGRALSERLSIAFGVPVVVENKPGAAGNLGAAEVAKAAPDGHTLLLTLYSIVTSNAHLYGKPAYDPLKDFEPIIALATTDSLLIANPSIASNSAAELIAYAKANPGKLNYASAGKASPGHVTGEYFGARTGAQMTHVPYKGNAEAVRSVLSNETQVMFTPSTVAIPLIKSGKVKALAVYLADRIDEFPDLRSLGAQGIAGFDLKSLPFWYGLLAPAGTPQPIIVRIHAETLKALRDEKVAPALRAARLFVIGNTPEEFAAMIRDDFATWGRVIREAGVKGE